MKEKQEKVAVVYAIMKRGEEPDFLSKVEEKYGYKVIKSFIDVYDLVSLKGNFKELSRLLTLIHRGEMKVDAIFVPSLKVFRSIDLYLFVKRLLELNGVELLSLRKGEKRAWKTSVDGLKSYAKRNFILESIIYGMLWASGIYLIYVLQEPLLSGLIIALLAFAGYTYYTRTYRRRKHMLKKLMDLRRIDKLKGKKNIRFNITFRGVEVIETPY